MLANSHAVEHKPAPPPPPPPPRPPEPPPKPKPPEPPPKRELPPEPKPKPPEPRPKPKPPEPAKPAAKTIAYNPQAYVPGGASVAEAKAIQAKGVREPGPHPVPVPASVATSAGVPPSQTHPYVPPAPAPAPSPPAPTPKPPEPAPPAVPATPHLSHADLMALWTLAGGLPGTEDTAAAIAQAESSGCQYALAGPVDIRPVKSCKWTVTDGENSCGLWQINLRAHPQYHAPAIFDKLANAEAAVAIANGGLNFEPWSTYKNGAYKQYLEAGGVPTAQPGTVSGGGSSSSSGGGNVNVPAGIGTAWRDVLHVYSTKVPQQHSELQKVADSLVTIFK